MSLSRQINEEADQSGRKSPIIPRWCGSSWCTREDGSRISTMDSGVLPSSENDLLVVICFHFNDIVSQMFLFVTALNISYSSLY